MWADWSALRFPPSALAIRMVHHFPLPGRPCKGSEKGIGGNATPGREKQDFVPEVSLVSPLVCAQTLVSGGVGAANRDSLVGQDRGHNKIETALGPTGGNLGLCPFDP